MSDYTPGCDVVTTGVDLEIFVTSFQHNVSTPLPTLTRSPLPWLGRYLPKIGKY